jgi:iron complex outermembrane receptor protein
MFFSEELTFNEKWSLSFGGRSDNVTYFNETYATSKNALTVKEEKSFKHFTPKLGLLYRLQPTQSIYASMSGGVEVPAGNETDPAQGQIGTKLFNILLEPIVSTTLEVGTKHILSLDDMFIKSVSYDVTLYSISIKNDIVPYQSGRFYLTAGKSSRKGIEISASSQMQHGLSMSLAVNASNNKYDEYIIDSVFTKRPIDVSLTGKTLDLSGNKTIGIPGLTMNVGLRYEPSMLQGIYVAGSLNHIGKYFANDINTLEVKAYSLVNATFGYNNPSLFDGKISLKAFVTLNNLFDTKYAASAFMNPEYGRVIATKTQAIYLEPGLPSNFVGSVSLGYNF